MPQKSKSNKKDELKPPTPDIVKKRLIKGGIRRVFRQSIEMRVVLQSARIELPPKTLKDGSVGKKNQVRYKCAVCGGLFSQKDVAVDHIEPVIPLHRSEEELTIDEMAYRIWCDVDNLQVICNTTLKKNNGIPSCHKIKTDEENFIRKRLKEIEHWNDIEDWADENDWIDLKKDILQLKVEYKSYLEEKEKERLEKERRKAEREAKRKAKK